MLGNNKCFIQNFNANVPQSSPTQNLNMVGQQVFVSSFNRENLYYEVRPKGKKDQTIKQIIQIIKGMPNQSGIIYVQSRKSAEEIARMLGGVKKTDQSLAHAESMIANAND